MQNVQEILEWYVEAGVDILLEDAPVNRFTESKVAAAEKTQAAKRPSPDEILARRTETQRRPAPAQATPATIPDAQAVETAQEMAAKCESLDALKTAMANFGGCNLKRTAKSLVFADGNPEAKIMFIGEAPGRDEDIQGLPFVGRAGQLLDKILAAIDLTRETAYISNVIPWRPPGNRTPTPQETEICRPFIERHIELVSPEIIVMLGGSSAKTLMKTTDGIMKLRGKWTELITEKSKTPAMPSLHPAYLLRQPAHKRLAWQDFLQVKMKLK